MGFLRVTCKSLAEPILLHSAISAIIMAVSPLVPHSPSVATPSATKVKLKATDTQSSAPKPGSTSSSLPPQNTDRELTEQLNDDVRHKYIKGSILFAISHGGPILYIELM